MTRVLNLMESVGPVRVIFTHNSHRESVARDDRGDWVWRFPILSAERSGAQMGPRWGTGICGDSRARLRRWLFVAGLCNRLYASARLRLSMASSISWVFLN